MTEEDERRAPLGPHLFEILLALAPGPAHGYGIVRDIRERTGDRVSLSTSTLYRGIDRLQARGLVEDAGEMTAESSGGPPRKYYRLTVRGRQTAELEAARLRDVMAVAEARLKTPGSVS